MICGLDGSDRLSRTIVGVTGGSDVSRSIASEGCPSGNGTIAVNERHIQGKEYGNALYAASFGGHNKIVEVLLDRGAEVVINVYSGPSEMFRSHIDTLRGRTQFGSHVVCLPTKFNGAIISPQGSA
jgi:hypothetical protein